MVKVLYEGQGAFNHYKVVEKMYNDRPARLLLAGNDAMQSGIALDDDPELLFDYNQRFLEVALSLAPKSVLVIGGGTFTLPSALVRRFPDTKVDVVEIEPLLRDIAINYFDLPDSPNLSIHIQDGWDYLKRCQNSYDLIIVDAFNEYDIPASFISKDAAKEYARLLSPRGTFTLNLIAVYYGLVPSLAHRLLDTFSSVFTSTVLYPTDPYYPRREEQNYLLIASHDPSPRLDYLQSASVL